MQAEFDFDALLEVPGFHRMLGQRPDATTGRLSANPRKPPTSAASVSASPGWAIPLTMLRPRYDKLEARAMAPHHRIHA